MKKLLSLSLVLSVTAFAGEKKIDVIYGDDNRNDVFESRNSDLVELSKSTAAMIDARALKTTGQTVKIQGSTLEARGICAQERFSHQVAGASCSGFIVADNVLVTAGHCIKTMSDCNSQKWVFDYKVENASQSEVSVPTSSVYSCKKIISRALNPITQDDYAVIELDRKVTDRRPLSFRRSGKVARGEEVAVIGHPTGLPTKITDKANVRSLNSVFFVANLDTYGGNSGSAVFNVKSGEVEGILVRGENDYKYDEKLGCQVSNKCANNSCRGEDVTYIGNVEALKSL